jgi:N-methylhydantoinase A
VSTPAPEGIELRKSFDEAYAAIYGRHGSSDEEIQLVRIRLSAFGLIAKPTLASAQDDLSAGPASSRPVYFEGTWHPSPVWNRAVLGYGARIQGPAVVEEFGATTVVPPGWNGSVDRFGNLILVAA